MRQPPRFHIESLTVGDTALPAAEAHHALSVLRLESGAAVRLFDGRGNFADGELCVPARGGSKRSRDVIARVTSVQTAPQPERALTLLVGGCKAPRLDWLAEKCAELGVAALRIIRTTHTVVEPRETHLDKLRRTAVEACKQCGGKFLPEIAIGGTLTQELARLHQPLPSRQAPQHGESRTNPDDNPALIVCDPDAEMWLTEAAAASRAPRVAAVIGPEGGLTPDEVRECLAAGALGVRLAPELLRVETAAISVAAAFAAARPPACATNHAAR
ncbi:MAG: 16S rRNA (uracil(1498)-N(3))-methyltransferase [Phycisphaerales bacterium]|nr:16S rRNA (uracil(1498)-N(3))-methyltransferase [Phycisphaerales bacterium]